MMVALSWGHVAALLCVYGLVRELRPSEPYVSEFLVGPWRNITQDQINQDVYPVGTYSYLALLVIVFLVTDYLKYKPLIILSGLSGIIVYSILLWTKSLEWLQASQFFYGLYMATDVAYLTYMFAKVEKSKYDKVASYTRSAALLGRFFSGLSAQLLVSFDVLDYRELNYITLSSQIFATIWVLFLPPVDKSIYFHKDVTTTISMNESPTDIAEQVKGLKLLWLHTKSAYTRSNIVGWSAWYAASTAGFYQVQYYMQILWIAEIAPEQKIIYNGIIEAILTVLGAGAALLAGIQKIEKKSIRNVLPAVSSAILAIAVVTATFAPTLWISYVGYISVGVVYHYMITVASIEIARNLKYDNCFGLIFGINTLVGLAIQSLLTFIAIAENGLGLDIKWQYIVYAIYFGLLSVFAIISWIFVYVHNKNQRKSLNEPM